MMYRLFLLLALILFPFNIPYSQPITFNTHIDVNDNSDWGRDIKQLPDSSFILVSLSACHSNLNISGFIGCVVVVKTDRYGKVIWKKEYKSPANLIHGIGIVPVIDGGFFIGGEADIPSKGIQKYLMKISSKGDSLWLKHYGRIADDDLISDYTGTPNGNLLLLGEIGKIGQNDSWDICLTKLNQEGNMIWQKKYGGDKLEGGSDIAIDSDGGYLIGGFTRSFSADEKNRAYLIKTDTSGTELWSRVYDSCDYETTKASIETFYNQSGYLMSCAIDSVYADGPSVGILIPTINRFDGEHNRLWTYHIESEYLKRGKAIPMKDGSIWIIGLDRTPIEEAADATTMGYIAKLSGEGELLWERQYAFPNKSIYIHITDLVETFDGGVALTGLYSYIENELEQNDIWLLKLDQDGCIEAGCDEPYLILEGTVVGIEDVENGEAFFEVYPNPNNGQANFYIQKELLLKGNVRVQILDINGRLIQEYDCPKNNKVLSIDTESLESGLYICILVIEGQAIAHTKMSVIK
ncbi:MAG: T9SS type A sorting domain-containing protein [Chitinophagales bacterium]